MRQEEKGMEDRLRQVHQRFQTGCSICGLLDAHQTRADAEAQARRHAGDGCETSVYDTMSHTKKREVRS